VRIILNDGQQNTVSTCFEQVARDIAPAAEQTPRRWMAMPSRLIGGTAREGHSTLLIYKLKVQNKMSLGYQVPKLELHYNRGPHRDRIRTFSLFRPYADPT